MLRTIPKCCQQLDRLDELNGLPFSGKAHLRTSFLHILDNSSTTSSLYEAHIWEKLQSSGNRPISRSAGALTLGTLASLGASSALSYWLGADWGGLGLGRIPILMAGSVASLGAVCGLVITPKVIYTDWQYRNALQTLYAAHVYSDSSENLSQREKSFAVLKEQMSSYLEQVIESNMGEIDAHLTSTSAWLREVHLARRNLESMDHDHQTSAQDGQLDQVKTLADIIVEADKWGFFLFSDNALSCREFEQPRFSPNLLVERIGSLKSLDGLSDLTDTLKKINKREVSEVIQSEEKDLREFRDNPQHPGINDVVDDSETFYLPGIDRDLRIELAKESAV